MNQTQNKNDQIHAVDDLDFYSIRENFLHDSLYDYLPEAEPFGMFVKPEDIDTTFSEETDRLIYSMKLTHFLVYTCAHLWPIFLDSVEKGFLLLEDHELVVTGDTRRKMLLAACIGGE